MRIVNPEWSLRDGRPEDAAAILDLWKTADATPSVTDKFDDVQHLLQHAGSFMLLAESEDQIIGTAIGTFDGWRGNIYRLVVHPAFRRRGIARTLVARIDQRLADQGAKRITALAEKSHPLATNFWDSVYDLDHRIVRYVHNL